MKQSAVEWLRVELVQRHGKFINRNSELFEQAKKFENQQIIEFANYCLKLLHESFETGEDAPVESMEELLENFKTKYYVE